MYFLLESDFPYIPTTTNSSLLDYRGKYFYVVLGNFQLYSANLFKEVRLKSIGDLQEND
jgi:hypothetical protein